MMCHLWYQQYNLQNAYFSNKAALGQDMVFADENGMPRVVPAKEALKEYEEYEKKK